MSLGAAQDFRAREKGFDTMSYFKGKLRTEIWLKYRISDEIYSKSGFPSFHAFLKAAGITQQ